MAGDVFDDNLVSAGTVARTLAAMREFAGPWVLLPGNHDADTAASIWSRLRHAGVPENLLLMVAVDPVTRGKGVGSQLIKRSFELAEGDVKLHVEYDNPAKRLYERLGMTNKYAEMRYHK